MTNEPMFKVFLKTLQNESEETKAMFFSDPEPDLFKAYQEGRDARLNKLPVSSNPYPESAEDKDGGKYNKNLCWSEGFLAAFMEE